MMARIRFAKKRQRASPPPPSLVSCCNFGVRRKSLGAENAGICAANVDDRKSVTPHQTILVTNGSSRFDRGIVLRSALAFFFVGALTLALSYILNNPLIIWPPAGVAFALAATEGPAAILGAALGSLALGLLAQLLPFQSGYSVAALLSALIVAGSVALRTAVGVWLLRRFRAFPFGGVNISSVGLFVLLGPVATGLIGAALSMANAIVFGDLAWSDAPFFGAVEWCSDALGIMIFTPIIVFYRRSRMGERLHNTAPLIGAGLLTLAVTTGAFAYNQTSQWRRIEGRVTDVAQEFTEKIEATLALGANAVGGLAGAFEGARERDLSDFEAIGRRLLAFGLGMQAVEWIPHVRLADLRSHEESFQKQWRRNYRVFERQADGDAVKPASRADYFPVGYVYPLEGNEGALGFDLASNPDRRAALLAARDTQEASATAGVHLVQNGQMGMLLFVPAFAPPGVDASKNLRGFALGVFSMPRLVDVALRGLGESDFDYWLIDQTDLEHPLDLDATVPGAPRAFRYKRLMPHHFVSRSPQFLAQTRIAFGARDWILILAPREGFVARRTSSYTYLIMVGGALLTCLVCGSAMLTTDRHREIVEDREKALENQKFALDQHAIVSISDPSGHILYVNDHFCRAAGRSRAELIGAKHSVLRSGVHDAAFYGELWATILRGEVWRGEICNRDAAGDLYWLQTTITPLKERSGRLSQFISISTEITPIKRLEDSLRSSEHRLNIALSASSTGLWDFDPAKDEAFFSDAWFLMLGYAPGELPSKRQTFISLLHPDDRPLFVEAFTAHARGQSETYEAEFRLRRNDGEWAWVKSVGKAVERDAHGAPTRVIGIHIDVTKEHEIQRRLVAAKASADRANEAKTNFLQTMSHEIRTPLNGMLGLAQLLDRELLSPDQSKMVQEIRHAGDSLRAIINDVLDFSKVEAGHLRLDFQAFSLKPILLHVRSLLDVTARSKGLMFCVEEAPELEGALIGDAHRLQQILMNLIGNAIKFTEKGEVRARVKLLTSTPQSVRLRFEVADTGIGISPHQIANLFEPFTQAEAAISRRFEGTGLGLSISKRLVKLMGGEIGVESLYGVGSTFWFEVPFERSLQDKTLPAAPPADEPKPEAGRLVGLRFLVVDDSRMNRILVERMLDREGAQVLSAENGAQALERLRAPGEAFDAVLMDVQMPVMDGLATTRIIREQLGLERLPVIALSAGVLDDQRQQVFEAGANDFLPKPVDLDELVATLCRWTRDIAVAGANARG